MLDGAAADRGGEGSCAGCGRPVSSCGRKGVDSAVCLRSAGERMAAARGGNEPTDDVKHVPAINPTGKRTRNCSGAWWGSRTVQT